MIVWGTSFGSHDAALTVFDTIDNRILFASHSERFSKKKDDGNLCSELIMHALGEYGMPDQVYYYENHMKKRMRYLRSGQWQHLFEATPTSILSNFDINVPVIQTDHHHSHAAAGYYTSGYSNAAVIVIDSIGEMETLTIWEGYGDTLRKKYSQSYPNSVGLFYSAMTQLAGYTPNGEEYIFMGLSGYGKEDPNAIQLHNHFVQLNTEKNLVEMKENLHQGVINYTSEMSNEDLAYATQKIYEKCLRHVANWAWNNIDSCNLIIMGGCALNCVANSKLKDWHNWKNIWIMPNPGDAGSSIGTILAHRRRHISWTSPYLGYNINVDYPVNDALNSLLSNKIVGVANGPAEFGPRALGNRSILADPRDPNSKERMNWLKKREQFRPFAAAIPEHLANEYFDLKQFKSSAYMQYVFECKDPAQYPGITHVDGTSRIQTVNAQQHPGFHQLLMAWYEKTGCPMVINTSLNIKNQPLVNNQEDANEFQEKYKIPVF